MVSLKGLTWAVRLLALALFQSGRPLSVLVSASYSRSEASWTTCAAPDPALGSAAAPWKICFACTTVAGCGGFAAAPPSAFLGCTTVAWWGGFAAAPPSAFLGCTTVAGWGGFAAGPPSAFLGCTTVAGWGG